MRIFFAFIFLFSEIAQAKSFGPDAQRVNGGSNSQATEAQQTTTFSNKCPAVIAEMTKEDAESSFFGVWEGQKRKCLLNIEDNKRLITATDLTDTLQGHYRDKMKVTTTPRECGLTENGTYAVGKFYYNQARLEAGQTKLLQELGDLAKLVPNEVPLSGSSTVELPAAESSQFFPKVQELQAQIKKCGAPGQDHLNKMAEGMMEADAIIAHYNLMHRCSIDPKGCKLSSASAQKQKAELQPLVDQIKEQYPWIFKDTFRAAVARGKSKESLLPGGATDDQRRAARLESYRNAVLAQTREEQKSRTEQLKKYTEASDCLLQSKPKDGLDCNSGRIRSVINSTPDVNTGVASIPFASRHLDVHECIHEGKIAQAEITRKSYLDAVGIGSAAVTGLLSLAKGAVSIAAGIRAGNTVKQAYKTQALAEMGLAGKAVAGIDVTAAVGGVSYDATKCQAERGLALTQLEAPKDQFQCEADAQQAVADLNNCEILSNVVMTGLPFLGFAAGPLSRKLAELRSPGGRVTQRQAVVSPDTLTQSPREVRLAERQMTSSQQSSVAGTGQRVPARSPQAQRTMDMLESRGAGAERLQLEEVAPGTVTSGFPERTLHGQRLPDGQTSLSFKNKSGDEAFSVLSDSKTGRNYVVKMVDGKPVKTELTPDLVFELSQKGYFPPGIMKDSYYSDSLKSLADDLKKTGVETVLMRREDGLVTGLKIVDGKRFLEKFNQKYKYEGDGKSVEFIYDPLNVREAGAFGYYSKTDRRIYMADAKNFVDTPDLSYEILHELTHGKNAVLLSQGKASPYHGTIQAREGQKLGDGTIGYDHFASFEELETYRKQAGQLLTHSRTQLVRSGAKGSSLDPAIPGTVGVHKALIASTETNLGLVRRSLDSDKMTFKPGDPRFMSENPVTSIENGTVFASVPIKNGNEMIGVYKVPLVGFPKAGGDTRAALRKMSEAEKAQYLQSLDSTAVQAAVRENVESSLRMVEREKTAIARLDGQSEALAALSRSYLPIGKQFVVPMTGGRAAAVREVVVDSRGTASAKFQDSSGQWVRRNLSAYEFKNLEVRDIQRTRQAVDDEVMPDF